MNPPAKRQEPPPEKSEAKKRFLIGSVLIPIAAAILAGIIPLWHDSKPQSSTPASEINKTDAAPPDSAQGWLRFSLKCDKPEHPNLSFFQRQPKWREAHNIAAEMDGHYKDFVDFPDRAGRFYGRAVRVVNDSQLTHEPSAPTEFCFKQKLPAPSNNAPKEAHLDCSEGKHCSVSDDDPGWFENCPSASDWTTAVDLIPTVYADERPQPAWKVPSLETLQKMTDRERVGYTQFSVQSSQLRELKADTVQYLIKANGSTLYVDGWAPDDMIKTFDPSKGFTFSFGLENLNFSGADGGCENIQLDLSFRQQGHVIKQVELSRKYAALRDAVPEDVKSKDGTIFAWSGTYVKPKNEDTSEVFGLTTSRLQDAQKAKDQLDAAQLTYDGKGVVGVLRPPLDRPNYGIAVGLQEPSGQVRFTFDKSTASSILSWILHLPPNQRSVLRANAFIYQMRPDERGAGKLKSCSSQAQASLN